MKIIKSVATLIGELAVIFGVLTPVIVTMVRLVEGQKCQLRSEMLKIYYRYREKEEIPQYEFENFSMLHRAYKALRGNSFIDKIWRDVQEWDITGKENSHEGETV